MSTKASDCSNCLRMERKPQSKLEGAAGCEERTLLRRRPSERSVVNYREPFEKGMNPPYRSSWRNQSSGYDDTRCSQWYPNESSHYAPLSVEYSVPVRVAGAPKHESSRELCYYNGAFRRGTPRPINPFSEDEWIADGGVKEIDADQGSSCPKHFSSSPHIKNAVVPTIRCTAQGRNKVGQSEEMPSMSQIGSDNSQAIRLQSHSAVPVKKGFLGRFSLRGRSKKAPTETSGKNLAILTNERSTSVESASAREASCTDLPSPKKSSRNTETATRICRKSSKPSKRSVGLTLPSSFSLKTDRTSKWEKVARKSRALFLKTRSQKMLKERLSKYRLVGARTEPISGDGVMMIGLNKRTSGIRLSDLRRSHNISKTGASGGTTHAMKKGSVSDKTVANTVVCGAQQFQESALGTPQAPKSIDSADLGFTPFFQGADWKRVVKEANDVSSTASANSSCISPIIPVITAAQIDASSSPFSALPPHAPDVTPNVLHRNAYEVNAVSPATNAVVDSASSSPETLYASTVKIEGEKDDVRIALAAPSHTSCSSDAGSSQSLGTSDIGIGDFSHSDFSCMDDDTKLKYMWTLVAKESSLNVSLNAVNEKLMKLRSEMVAVVNERNQIEKDIMEVRGTKSRLLQSAGDHGPLHESFGGFCDSFQ
uniref:C2H2-type domain-containing protein n=1 Tax=Parascaris univalens TaxID=6257 RepID=A0A915BS44_PARUN